MAVVLGLAVAVAYGTGDFLGGLSAKRNPVLLVVACSQAVGLVLLALAATTVGRGEPGAADLALGAAGGVGGLVGLVLLYRGLATGAMGVVAPVTAVAAAVVPVLWGLATGERPSAVALAGMAAALVAVALVAAEGPSRETPAGEPERGRGLGLALGAGAAFGAFFVALAATNERSGLWPTVSARVASLVEVGVVLRVLKTPRSLAPGTAAGVAGAGALDALANALFVAAVRQGLVSLVAVVVSLYPAATVALARVVLRERVARRQAAGLGLALAGVALIAGG